MADETVVYINGEFKPLSEANISVLDQGFLLGDAVFDVVSAWKGVIFKLVVNNGNTPFSLNYQLRALILS